MITIKTQYHGVFKCKATTLDLMMACYLPATLPQLAEMINERDPRPEGPSYWRLASIVEGLMILAELDGLGL